MKNRILTTLLLLIGLSINAQSDTSFTPTEGEIVFKEISKITDRKAFDESLEISKQKFKESLKKSLLKQDENERRDQEIDYHVALASEMLETLAYTQDSSKVYYLQFEGSEIKSLIMQDEETENIFTKENYPYSSNIILKIVEDKKSKRTINGYDCYKVIYEYKENDEEADEDYLLFAGNTVYRREMWVTDKIKSLYHPILFEKKILEKFYPLDILETQSDIKGFERRFVLQNITLK